MQEGVNMQGSCRIFVSPTVGQSEYTAAAARLAGKQATVVSLSIRPSSAETRISDGNGGMVTVRHPNATILLEGMCGGMIPMAGVLDIRQTSVVEFVGLFKKFKVANRVSFGTLTPHARQALREAGWPV